MSKGFAIVATGNKKYYKQAQNLLFSYLYVTKNPYPIILITDENNKMVKGFSRIIRIKEPKKNVFDKLSIFQNELFDETIFFESDCLFFKDPNFLFEYFAGESICGLGKESYLDDDSFGYFTKNSIPKDLQLKKKVAMISSVFYVKKNSTKIFLETFNKVKSVFPSCSFRFDSPIPNTKGKDCSFRDELYFDLVFSILGLNVKSYDKIIGVSVNQKTKLQIWKNKAIIGENDYVCAHYGTFFTIEPKYKYNAFIAKHRIKSKLLIGISIITYNAIYFLYLFFRKTKTFLRILFKSNKS